MATKAMVLAVALAAGGLCHGNEAAVLVFDGAVSVYEREAQRHRAALEEITRNMTMDDAMAVLKVRASPKLAAIVEMVLAGPGHASSAATASGPNMSPRLRATSAVRASLIRHRGQHEREDVMKKEMLVKGNEAPKENDDMTYLKKVDQAKDTLNQMIYEVQTQYEIEHKKCCDYERSKRSLVEGAAQDIALFNAEAAKARALILSAQSQIGIVEGRLPKLRTALDQHNRECDASLASLKKELAIAVGDRATMTSLANMTECKKIDTAAMLQFEILQCTHPCAEGAHVLFADGKIRSAIRRLRSANVRQQVQHSLLEARTPTVHWYKLGALLQRELDRELAEELEEEIIAEQNSTERLIKPHSPCQKPVPLDKNSPKCVVGAGSCAVLQERLLGIYAGIVDKQIELREEIGRTESTCTAMKESLTNQVSQFATQLLFEQSNLAGATKTQNTADEQSRLQSVEKRSMESEFSAMTQSCHKNYEAFENQECGLKKLRGQLYKLNAPGKQIVFEDCQLSAWSAGPCSASCGGGTQTLTRTIMVAPRGGVRCLPLERVQPCNEQKCPLDCRVGDWQSWSGCTAECGGGVMQRARPLQAKPKYGGKPCGEVSEVYGCNLQSCNADCVLGVWSQWSSCSKGCGGGQQRRSRLVAEPAKGAGKCPHEKSDERLQFTRCNTQACPKDLACDSKLDVVLMLDGSSLVGANGFESVKKAGQEILRALGTSGKAMVSLILFSGPTTLQGLSACTNEDPVAPPPKMAQDCNIQVISHLTIDTFGLAEKVQNLAWPAGSALTSVALGMAEAELTLGRKDAPSLVLLLTRGRPLSADHTTVMAGRLRKKARVVWVPVVGSEPLERFRKWSSDPDDENILAVKDFAALKDRATIDTIVAAMCPNVATQAIPPPPSHEWDFRGCAGDVKEAQGTLLAKPMGGAKCTDQGVYMNGEKQFIAYDPFYWGSTIAYELSVRYEAMNEWSRVFDCGEGPYKNDILLANEAGTNAVRVEVNRVGLPKQELTAPNFWQGGAFQHVVVTFSGGIQRLYKNGVQILQRSGLMEPLQLTRPNCWSGRSQYQTDKYFKGTLSYLRVWQGVAITPENVAEMYKTEAARYSYYVVFDGKITLKTPKLEAAKKQLMSYTQANTPPERIICELVDGVVTMDRRFLGPDRENQEAGLAAGINKWWQDAGSAEKMLKLCEASAQSVLKACEINPDESARSYSSVFEKNAVGTGHARSMINSVQAWSAKENKIGEWMTIDLGAPREITGVLVQGRANSDQTVTKYQVSYSLDNSAFTPVKGEFERSAAASPDAVSRAAFQEPVTGRYVRFLVLAWEKHVSMRAAISTCKGR